MCAKILFCDNSLRELLNFRGGVIKHYALHGFEVVLVAPKALEDARMETGVRHISVELERSGMNPLHDWHYFRMLCDIYKREKPDYIFHYTIKPNIYGTLAAHLYGIPSSAVIAGLGYVFQRKSMGCRFARWLYKFALKFTDHVLVLNVANRDLLLQHRMVNPAKLIHLQGGEGIDLQKFSIWERGSTSRKTIFLMIARLLYDKGYEEYVQAARIIKRECPDVEFQLLGDIDIAYPKHVPPERVEQDHLEGHICYLGYSPDVIGKIQYVDCVVLPSYHEGLSRVLLEALALGKPIITSDIPGCRETVEVGKNGFLVKPQDTSDLADAMKKFLAISHEEKLEMGKYARMKAEREFDVKDVIKKYQEVTNKII